MEKGRSAARVQRVQKVVLAAGAAGWGRLRRRLCRRGRRPFGPRVVVSPLRGDEYEVSVTGLPSRPHLRAFCIECASRPKPSLSLHIKGPSDCRLTDPG